MSLTRSNIFCPSLVQQSNISVVMITIKLISANKYIHIAFSNYLFRKEVQAYLYDSCVISYPIVNTVHTCCFL